MAHRGASVLAPENTLAAFRRAIALGAGAVEIDVRRTRDGALVVLHDATLSRTTDAQHRLPGRDPWRVADLTYDEVAGLDAGSWHDRAYAGERVPLLREVLDLLHGTGTGLLLEVKAPASAPGIEADLHAELRSATGYLGDALWEQRLVVQSFDHDSMRRFKEQAPDVPVGLLGSPPRRRLPSSRPGPTRSTRGTARCARRTSTRCTTRVSPARCGPSTGPPTCSGRRRSGWTA